LQPFDLMIRETARGLTYDELDAGRTRRDSVATLIEKSRATRTRTAALLDRFWALSRRRV